MPSTQKHVLMTCPAKNNPPQTGLVVSQCLESTLGQVGWLSVVEIQSLQGGGWVGQNNFKLTSFCQQVLEGVPVDYSTHICLLFIQGKRWDQGQVIVKAVLVTRRDT